MLQRSQMRCNPGAQHHAHSYIFLARETKPQRIKVALANGRRQTLTRAPGQQSSKANAPTQLRPCRRITALGALLCQTRLPEQIKLIALRTQNAGAIQLRHTRAMSIDQCRIHEHVVQRNALYPV